MYGLVGTGQQHAAALLARGSAPPWHVSFLIQMGLAMAWAAATPGVIWLGRRFPFERGRVGLSLAVHVSAAVLLALTLNAGYAYLALPHLPPPPTPVPTAYRAAQLFVGWVLADTMLYAAILSVSVLARHREQFRTRELATAQLETQLARAELRALEMQLQPHFVFNALHTVSALVRTGDRDAAVRVVTGLGDLLRRVLDRAPAQEVLLREELDFARAYLEIEQVRFRDRLRVEVAAEPAVLDARVPRLVLQPLVENAIRHGVAPTPGPCTVRVAAARAGSYLCLSVADDGTAPAPAPDTGGGIGLANTRARLARLYGEDGQLVLLAMAPRGHEVRVSLPWRAGVDG